LDFEHWYFDIVLGFNIRIFQVSDHCRLPKSNTEYIWGLERVERRFPEKA
jgi:hypothetical protein